MILKTQLASDIVKSKGILRTEFSDNLDQSTQFKQHNKFKALVVTDSLYAVNCKFSFKMNVQPSKSSNTKLMWLHATTSL